MVELEYLKNRHFPDYEEFLVKIAETVKEISICFNFSDPNVLSIAKEIMARACEKLEIAGGQSSFHSTEEIEQLIQVNMSA